jgi:hypothetical protein
LGRRHLAYGAVGSGELANLNFFLSGLHRRVYKNLKREIAALVQSENASL